MSVRAGPATVLVADDHPIYREGVARAIRERTDLELVAECADGAEALRQIEARQPDVAVLDLSMPIVDGMEVLSALPALRHQTRALILSADTESTVVYEAIAAGAAGYVTKEASRRSICDAIAAVARGETVVGPRLGGALADEIRSRRPGHRPILTEREREILRLTADGYSRIAIGKELHIGATTVKTHMEHVYEKLGVCDRAAAVAVALRAGLLT